MFRLTPLALLISPLALQSCGDKDAEDTSGTVYCSPEANAGADQSVALASVVTLDATGKVLAAESLGAAGPDAAPTLALGQLEGGLMWGLGAALVEELLCTDGLPDVRIRNMGLLKAPLTPPLSGVLVPKAGGPRALGEVASLAVAPAVAAALAQVEGKARTSLPMRDNEAAWGVGAKRPRGGPTTAPTSA